MSKSETKIVIDFNDNNINCYTENDTDDNINELVKSHQPITLIEISPNGKYLVTYSKNDFSIVGWNVDESSLEPYQKLRLSNEIDKICVSDDKILVCLYHDKVDARYIIEGIYDMEQKNLKIILNFNSPYCNYCIFNLKGEFILCCDDKIYIYSKQIKNNTWKCKRIYMIPEDHKLIGISKYDKLYLSSDNTIYESNIIITEKIIKEKIIKIFGSDEKINNKARISNNEMFICIRINNKIIIFSNELEIPIVSLDIINNDTQLYNLIHHTGLISLLLPLINDSIIMENCWNEFLHPLNENDQLSKEYQTESFSLNIRTTTEYAFGILDGNIWMIKLEKILAKMVLTHEDYDDGDIENWYFDDNLKINKTYDHLNILLFNSYLYKDTIHTLFNDVIDRNREYKSELIHTHNLIKWVINIQNGDKFMLKVFKKINVNSQWDEPELICTRVEKLNLNDQDHIKLLGIKSHDDNNIIVLTTKGLFIYHFNENNKSISLNYYCYFEINQLVEFKEKFLEPTLPVSNYDSFKHCNEWVSYVKNDKESLLKHGGALLTFGIKEHKLDLMEDIYKKCINYFKEDSRNNIMFLSIITSTMPLLNKYYPGYISRYSSGTTMIIDNMEYKNNKLHLYPFFHHSQIISSSWEKYDLIFYIFNYIKNELKSLNRNSPSIILMNPYIKFINYPQEYKWYEELIKPQPSPFVETINEDIYKTWSGESLINFKWNTYGKYYYFTIWTCFTILLGFFTAAVATPQQNIDENARKLFLIITFVLGIILLNYEVRQFIYNPKKWVFDLSGLHFSDLFVESFGIFFAIILIVWQQMIGLLMIMFIITIGFAHAFYILLSPEDFSFNEPTNNNDPNNPWNLIPTYNHVFENGTIDHNPFMVQPPDENTNMFVNFSSSIFATYKFLTGDPSVLSNWQYNNNLSLEVMYITFSSVMAIYIMNLFIGLLSNAIEGVDFRVLYLIYKAEVLAEIELFYLLPCQRRWKTWFPEVLYYYADIDKVYAKVKEMVDKDEWKVDEFSELKKDLLIKLNIQPVDVNSLQKLSKEIEDIYQRIL
ncbi:hypothetical protein RclHR1_03040011 [Rhizophagus clarus]|uniref:Ion transport domain-containing protein n=1 Tax=Rhizophagus clarus TaxID=94130 RepID=A0A2Z6RHY1_9GLOM|nr:hypothetical protein RclHR1_03040011 [Rhizophagus clarus]